MIHEIHKPGGKYPKLIRYIREWEIERYQAEGWKLVGIQPVMTSVNNFLVEKEDA